MKLKPPIEAMEMRQVHAIPKGDDWIYEPKWDGFRCIAFRDNNNVELQSKSGQTLTRYFPEIVATLQKAKAKQFALDGELYIETKDGFDFDALLQRIHPAESRVRMLAKRTPATYAIFDLLLEGDCELYKLNLSERRKRLEAFAGENFERAKAGIVLSPATKSFKQAEKWFAGGAARTDGVIAKRDQPYSFGSRDAAVKIKRRYTADCVIGGFRLAKDGRIASLLLGLYDDDGSLDHVGFVGSMNAEQRKKAAQMLKPIIEPPGFTGSAPGGPSRWRKAESTQWFPVRPQVVVEVSFDHITGERFRHAARLLRWRPDKAPELCTMEQLDQAFSPRLPND